MIKPENMHSDHFEIKGSDAPITMWHMYDLDSKPGLVTVAFDTDHDNGFVITGAWLGDEELGLSFSDRDAFILELEVYQDNQRQDIAEGGI